MKISKKQIEMLRPYIPEINEFLEKDDICEFELFLDHLIVDIGLDKNGEINADGLILQKLYDEIYLQNDD